MIPLPPLPSPPPFTPQTRWPRTRGNPAWRPYGVEYPGASVVTLRRRAGYGGRKGRRAEKRLRECTLRGIYASGDTLCCKLDIPPEGVDLIASLARQIDAIGARLMEFSTPPPAPAAADR